MTVIMVEFPKFKLITVYSSINTKCGYFFRKKSESTVVHQSGEEYDSDTLDGKMLHIKKRAVAE